VKATIPSVCCLLAFVCIAWQLYRGSGDLRLDQAYKVDIVVKGPDGAVIPIIGRAPR